MARQATTLDPLVPRSSPADLPFPWPLAVDLALPQWSPADPPLPASAIRGRCCAAVCRSVFTVYGHYAVQPYVAVPPPSAGSAAV
uniref:Uncharacterized protein n=1 Tax=Oryza sativa subsp. japonica TaxID=39947 RepID=Q84RU9_ORYSJ|nr:hypothetical protein [Oryza sativa Japonica Group]